MVTVCEGRKMKESDTSAHQCSHVNSLVAVSEVTFGSRRSTEMEMVTVCAVRAQFCSAQFK